MSRPVAQVCARAPAKVNLALRVGQPGADGFHDLATVFHAVSLFEDVTATLADDLTCAVEGEGAELVPAAEGNIAVRAARLLAARTGVDAGAHLRIHKQVPVAGGMAGGSADAAATLVACDALWGTGLSRAELADVGARLGADVPFALLGGTALGTGRGDRVTPVLGHGHYHWVLALADATLSTPQVYAECDRLRSGRAVPEPRVADRMMQALRSGDAASLGATMVNDLQPAAVSLLPVLDHTLEVGRGCDALGSLVSGSGPTVAFLVADPEAALDLAVALTAAGVARAVHRVHGPVPGTRLVEPVAAHRA